MRKRAGALLIAMTVGYAIAYLVASHLEDRSITKGVYGGLAGHRYSRHFRTETLCLSFLPLLWVERAIRAGDLDVTIDSGEYRRIIWLF